MLMAIIDLYYGYTEAVPDQFSDDALCKWVIVSGHNTGSVRSY